MNWNKLKRRFRQFKCLVIFYLVKTWTIIYRKPVDYWLISERGNDARDNGYVFYRFLKREHPDIKIKYAITPDSPDRKRVDDVDVIKYGSLKHYYSYITSPMLLSTHYQGYSPNFELFAQLDRRGLSPVRGKKVLLDHCVRMGKAGCTNDTVKVDMMVCSIHREYDALLHNAGYEPRVLCDIGMPRFDNLYTHINMPTKKQILFMPTWRVKYTNSTEKVFINSDYYKSVKNLIENEELIKFLKDKDLNFVFYPHIEMQKFISLFHSKDDRILIREAGSAVVEDLLLDSQLLITDYSSVFFDFAYLNKPVLYFHFDNDENIKADEKRWFSFERDGLGEVCYSADEIIEKLKTIDLIKPNDVYISRSNALFGIKDDRNSQRVYDAVCALLKE